MQKEKVAEEEQEEEEEGKYFRSIVQLEENRNGKRRRTGLLDMTPQPELNIIHSLF